MTLTPTTTAELRWFFHGPPPAALLRELARLGAGQVERVDRYLVLAGTDALGIKLRGGGRHLEVKLRQAELRGVILPRRISGRVEQWLKWSFPRRRLARLTPRLGLRAGVWVDVTKLRRTVTFAPGPGGQIAPIEGNAPAGCRIELALLTIGGDQWSTFAFEAFGRPGELAPMLTRTAEVVLAGFDLGFLLIPSGSMGYPAWLGHVLPST